MTLPQQRAGEPHNEDMCLAVWEIVQRVQDGDTEAYAHIYSRYHFTVYMMLLRHTRDQALAEDLAAETFTKALARIGSYTYQGRDFGAWLMTIAGNLMRDHFKSKRNQLERPVPEILDMDYADTDREGLPESVVDEMDRAEFRAKLDLLPRNYREVIVLRFLRERSASEAAALMGVTEGSLKALQWRAMNAFAAVLGAVDENGCRPKLVRS